MQVLFDRGIACAAQWRSGSYSEAKHADPTSSRVPRPTRRPGAGDRILLPRCTSAGRLLQRLLRQLFLLRRRQFAAGALRGAARRLPAAMPQVPGAERGWGRRAGRPRVATAGGPWSGSGSWRSAGASAVSSARSRPRCAAGT